VCGVCVQKCINAAQTYHNEHAHTLIYFILLAQAEEIMKLLAPQSVEQTKSTGAKQFEIPISSSLAESVEHLMRLSAEMKFDIDNIKKKTEDIDTIKKQTEEILKVPSHTRMLSAPLASQCHCGQLNVFPKYCVAWARWAWLEGDQDQAQSRQPLLNTIFLRTAHCDTRRNPTQITSPCAPRHLLCHRPGIPRRFLCHRRGLPRLPSSCHQ
jgi:hypothetical protein